MALQPTAGAAPKTNAQAIADFKKLNDSITAYLHQPDLTYDQRQKALAAYHTAVVELQDAVMAPSGDPFELSSDSAKEVMSALKSLKSEIGAIQDAATVAGKVLSALATVLAIAAKFAV